eukprot:SAG31_NODE_24374_length_483_cov_0.533854_1_plen_37_part_01
MFVVSIERVFSGIDRDNAKNPACTEPPTPSVCLQIIW